MADEFEQHKKDQAFEHELINRRLTWLLTSQSIFFASLAFVLGKEVDEFQKDFFMPAISALGFFISVFIFIGVLMAIMAKYINYKKFKTKHEPKPKQEEPKKLEDQIQWGENTTVTKIALVPDLLMPLAFAVTWICIWLKLH